MGRGLEADPIGGQMQFTQCGKITFVLAAVSIIAGTVTYISTTSSAAENIEAGAEVTFDCNGMKSCEFEGVADFYSILVSTDYSTANCTVLSAGLSGTDPDGKALLVVDKCDWSEPDKFDDFDETQEVNGVTYQKLGSFSVAEGDEGTYKISHPTAELYIIGNLGALGEALGGAMEEVGNALFGLLVAVALIIGGLICCCAPCCCCQVK